MSTSTRQRSWSWARGACFGLAILGALAHLTSPAAAITTGTVAVDDDSPNISPAMTFTYTLTKARSGTNDNLIRIFGTGGRPANFPAWTNLSCTDLFPLVTVKVNSVTQDNSTFLDPTPSFCGSYTASLLLRLKTGAPTLAAGDTIEIKFASGLFNNPATSQTGTWTWRASNAGGGDDDEFQASLTAGGGTGPTTTTTTTTTTSPTTTIPEGGGSDGSGSGGSGEPEDLSDSGVDALTLTALAAALLSTGVALRRRTRPA